MQLRIVTNSAHQTTCAPDTSMSRKLPNQFCLH